MRGDITARAKTTLAIGLAGVGLSAAATLVDAARGFFCLGPAPAFDVAVLGLQLASAAMLGASLGLESRRQRRAWDDDARGAQMVGIALLGCVGLAVAAFLISMRLGSCAAA